MKKMTVLMLAWVFVGGMAFGMGMVEAEETPQATATIGETPAATPTPESRARIEVEKKEYGVDIRFIDKNDQIIKQIKLEGEVGRGYGRSDGYIYYLTKPNSRGIVVTHVRRKKQTKDIIYSTGFIYKYMNNFIFYGENGEIQFQKENVEYLPLRISPSGNYLTCYKTHAYRDDLYSYEVKDSILQDPPSGKFNILNRQGDIVYHFDNSINTSSVLFSEDDKWILFFTGRYRLLNTANMRIDADFEEHLVGAATIRKIFNDAEMLLIKRIHPRKSIYETSIFNPFSKTGRNIGILNSLEVKEYIEKEE